jgi:hypothetical protein
MTGHNPPQVVGRGLPDGYQRDRAVVDESLFGGIDVARADQHRVLGQ